MKIAWYVVVAYVLAAVSLVYIYMEFALPYDFLSENAGSDAVTATAVARGSYEMADSTINLAYITATLLLLLANIDYWRQKHTHMFWLSIGYMAFYNWMYFTLLEAIFLFKKQNGLWEGGFSLNSFAPVVITILFALGVLVNYSTIKYLRNRKMKTA
jgi:hypothetical protein